MHFNSLTSLFGLLASTAVLANALPHQAREGIPVPICGTCNPLSGENHCHPTTSCISTGDEFHCACRAGYKASHRDHDILKQFRIPFDNYEFLVFTTENTECNILCDDYTLPPPQLCSEVPLYDHCDV